MLCCNYQSLVEEHFTCSYMLPTIAIEAGATSLSKLLRKRDFLAILETDYKSLDCVRGERMLAREERI